MERFEVFCVADARIRELEHDFALTRAGLHPIHDHHPSVQTPSESPNSLRATTPLQLDVPTIIFDCPATPFSIDAWLFRAVYYEWL
jgi:hypothetical protein